MHIQLQVEIVLEKQSLGRWKKPQEIPSCNSASATRATYQRSATRATHQLSITFSLNHFKLSAIMLQPRTKPRTTIRPLSPYGLDSAAFEDQVRHVGTALRKGSRLRAATFPIDAYPNAAAHQDHYRPRKVAPETMQKTKTLCFSRRAITPAEKEPH